MCRVLKIRFRQVSLYCLVDEPRQGCFVPCRRKKKNKNLDFDSGRREKKVEKWLFIVKINYSVEIYAVLEKKNPLIFGHVGEKNIFPSGITSPRRRTSSTKQYSESCLIGISWLFHSNLNDFKTELIQIQIWTCPYRLWSC